ncbi:MAG: M48 family metallopeptidase [Lysobacteraceae bacterium]
MNFFERQEVARRGSRRLVILFTLAVACIIVAVSASLLLALGVASPTTIAESGGLMGFARSHGGVFAGVAVVTGAVIGLASLVRIAGLRAGGGVVARELGGVAVAQDTVDPALRRLRNVVEEIAIASGVPVPEIFVLEREAGINAFAAGYSANDAAIAVTRGALDRLNRAELQGVIAHEFSHVLNGDMRLNIRLMGVLFGILVLAVAGRKVLQHSRGNSRDGAGIMVAALALLVLGYIGLFFGRLIKAGVSRQREYLADASAVQFTRQTEGLAGALKKIAGVSEGSKLAAADTEEVSHMLFGDGVGYSALMATHPPLLARIQALEPTFDGKALAALKTHYRKTPPNGLAEDRVLGLDGGEGGAVLPRVGDEVGVSPAAVVRQVAAPASDDYRHAGELHGAMPALLMAAARSHDGSMALVLALLLDADAGLRSRQLDLVGDSMGAETLTRVHAMLSAADALHPALRLPLAALAFPALRRRPRPQLKVFIDCSDALIHLDGRIGLFEYCLARMLRRQVIEALDPSRYAPTGRRKLAACAQAVGDLFSVLARHGHADPLQAAQAHASGVSRVLPGIALRYRPPADWVAAMDGALSALDGLEPMGKELLVEGLVLTCSHDGRINVAEAELLRTICACLHCPLPPVLDR